MIKSKTQGSIQLKKTLHFSCDNNIRLEASESNYQCFFCHKKLFSNTIYNLTCAACGSQWVEKLPSKHTKVYNAC